MNELANPLAISIKRLEETLLELPQAPIRTVHSFKAGIYERKIIIPPWTVLTGAEHRTDYRVRIEKGVIAVNTDSGVMTFTAPCEFEVKAGIKRAGRVFEQEVVWVDIYSNEDDCRDIPTIEQRLYAITETGLGENRRIHAARDDYEMLLKQLGIDQKAMDVMVCTDDVTDMDILHIQLRESSIHGKGLFALRDFSQGETIGPGRINGNRTIAGRFMNHSPSPNVIPVMRDGDIYAVALTDILCDEELLVNYRDSVKVNIGLEVSKCPVG